MVKSQIALLSLSRTIIFEQNATVTHDTETIEENNQPPQNASIVFLLIVIKLTILLIILLQR